MCVISFNPTEQLQVRDVKCNSQVCHPMCANMPLPMGGPVMLQNLDEAAPSLQDSSFGPEDTPSLPPPSVSPQLSQADHVSLNGPRVHQKSNFNILDIQMK